MSGEPPISTSHTFCSSQGPNLVLLNLNKHGFDQPYRVLSFQSSSKITAVRGNLYVGLALGCRWQGGFSHKYT